MNILNHVQSRGKAMLELFIVLLLVAKKFCHASKFFLSFTLQC